MATATAGNGRTMTVADEGERTMQYQPFGSSEIIKLSVNIVKEFVCAKTKNGHVASDATCMKFMMLCKARGLNPFEGDAFLIGYDSQDGPPTFSIVTAHQAFLKRAEAHPQYDGMESGVIVRTAEGKIEEREGDFVFEEDFILGGWAKVYRRDRKYPMFKRLKLGTFAKNTAIWKNNPCGMIVKCAEADALRATFPNTLGGMYTQEEAPQIVEEAPKKPALAEGRTSLRKPKPEPIPVRNPEPETTQEEQPEVVDVQPEPETHADGEIIDPDEVSQGFIERCQNAKTTGTLDAIGKEMRAAKHKIGENGYAAVKAVWDECYRALS